MLVINTRNLTHNGKDRTFSCEASDLGCPIGQGPDGLSRLYQDACDIGLELESHVTGRRQKFAYSGAILDRFDNDVLYWLFTVATPYPQVLAGYKFIVFND